MNLYQEIYSKTLRTTLFKDVSTFRDKKYINNTYVWHLDNITFFELDSHWWPDSFKNGLFIYNIDTIQQTNDWVPSIERKPLIRFIYFTNPWRFQEYFKQNNSVYLDIVVFIMFNNQSIIDFRKERETGLFLQFDYIGYEYEQNMLNLTFWTQTGMEKASRVFVVHGYFTFYTCFFCGNKTGDLIHIISKKLEKLPENNYENFHGHTLNIGYNTAKPFICDESDKFCEFKQSIEFLALDETSKRLNFQYKLNNIQKYQRFQKRPLTVNTTNIDDPWIRPWSLLLNLTRARKYDIAIGALSLIQERKMDIDYIGSFSNEKYIAIFFTTKEQHWGSVWTMLLPFNTYLWLLLTFATLVIILIIHYLEKLFDPHNDYKFQYLVMNVWEATWEQSEGYWTTYNFHSISVRVIIILWFLSLLILTTGYKTELFDIMLNGIQKDPDFIEDLIDKNFRFGFLKDTSVVESSPFYKQIADRSLLFTDTCEAFNSTFQEDKLVIMGEESILLYDLIYECRRRKYDASYYDFIYNNLRQTHDLNFLPQTYVWFLQHETPYKDNMNEFLTKMSDFGLYDKWKRDAFTGFRGNYLQASNMEEMGMNILTIKNFYSPLLFWVLGLIVSVLVFLIEYFYHKHMNVYYVESS